jgi:hypothetical protein
LPLMSGPTLSFIPTSGTAPKQKEKSGSGESLFL